jgi:two-component sensor histidine kinase
MNSTADRSNTKSGNRKVADSTRTSRHTWSRFSLRHRLLLLTALALLPAFLIVVANHLSLRSVRSAEVDAYAVKMTDVVLNEVVRGLTAAATMMIAMGRSTIVQGQDVTACEAYTGAIQRDLVTIMDIAVADANGAVYCHSGKSATANLQAEVDALVAADKPSLVIGGYTHTPGGASLPIGMALRKGDGSVEGYIQLNVNMAALIPLVTAATKDVPDSRTTVTDRNGTIMLSLPEGDLKPGQPLPSYLADLVHADEPGTVRLTGPDGTREIIGYRPASDKVPIATVFARPEAPTMAPIDRAAITNSLIALAGAGLAFLLAWFIGTVFIQRPVNTLNRAVSARRAGDQTARTGLTGDGSEFGVIGRSVDDLFDELNRREELQQRTEEQRDLFAREVQHRVKNLLAIIQVIARQTLARPDAAPEVLIFENRINAIIRTNTRLLAQNDRAGLVGDLVHEAVAPFVGTGSERIEIEGPAVRLHAKAASALAMALHELATNAVKYGALSNEDGRVGVHWRITADAFEMNWSEQNGPSVAAPAKSGFGSILISRVLQAETRGTVSTDFAEHGFTFRLLAPLDILEDDEPVSSPEQPVP